MTPTRIEQSARWFILIPGAVALATVAGGVVYYLADPDVPFLSGVLAWFAPVYFCLLALLEGALAWRARAYFAPGQALRFAWGWWTTGALMRLAGFLVGYGAGDRRWGEVLSGLFAGALGLLGMLRVLNALQLSQWRQPLRWSDRLIVGVLAIYLAHHIWMVASEISRRGFGPPVRTILWLVPILLLVQGYVALVIRRSMRTLGSGRLSQCWSAVAASVLLIVVGNLWLLLQSPLNFPAGLWLLMDTIWLLPYTLSALAPALQVEASAIALDSAALRALHEKDS